MCGSSETHFPAYIFIILITAYCVVNFLEIQLQNLSHSESIVTCFFLLFCVLIVCVFLQVQLHLGEKKQLISHHTITTSKW